MTTPGEIKRRLTDAEEELGAKQVRYVVVSRPPTEAQLAHRAKLEAEGFAVTFVLDPFFRPPQDSSL